MPTRGAAVATGLKALPRSPRHLAPAVDKILTACCPRRRHRAARVSGNSLRRPDLILASENDHGCTRKRPPRSCDDQLGRSHECASRPRAACLTGRGVLSKRCCSGDLEERADAGTADESQPPHQKCRSNSLMVEIEQLAASVLLQAICDAGLRSGSSEDLRTVRPFDRAEARSFLTAHFGDWKKAREWWCAIAGRDPEDLRRWAAAKLGLPIEVPSPPVPPKSSGPLQLFYPVPKPTKPAKVPKPPKPPRAVRKTIPKRPSKRSQVVEMLLRPEGASLDEIAHRFGWKRTTAHSCVSYDVRKDGVRGLRCRDGRYRAFSLP